MLLLRLHQWLNSSYIKSLLLVSHERSWLTCYMIRYFYGEDTYGARQALEEMAAASKATVVFKDKGDLEQESLAALLDRGSRGLFGQELVVVRDPSTFPVGMQQNLAEVQDINTAAEVVLWDRVKPDKRSAFFKTFKKSAQEFPALSESELAAWLLGEAKKMASEIELAAAQELVRRVGADRWQLLQELQKLTLQFSAVNQLQVKESVDAPAHAELIFALTDAILQRDRARAMVVLESLLAAGEKEISLLGFIASQIRMLLLVQRGVQAGLSSEAIAKQYGFHPYPVQKSMSAVKRFSRGQLLDIYTRILATDFAVKGKVEPRTGITMLVLGMTEGASSRS